MPKLKKLDIDFSYNSVECLTISQTAINALCKMKSLNKLFILDSFQVSEQNILKIVSEMNNLKTLSIMTNEISIETLHDIVVRARNMTKGEFKISARTKLGNQAYDTMHRLVSGRGQNLKLCIHKECGYDTFRSELYLFNSSKKPNLTISRIYNAYKSILADTAY